MNKGKTSGYWNGAKEWLPNDSDTAVALKITAPSEAAGTWRQHKSSKPKEPLPVFDGFPSPDAKTYGYELWEFLRKHEEDKAADELWSWGQRKSDSQPGPTIEDKIAHMNGQRIKAIRIAMEHVKSMRLRGFLRSKAAQIESKTQ